MGYDPTSTPGTGFGTARRVIKSSLTAAITGPAPPATGVSIDKKFPNRGMCRMDLIQEGNDRLIQRRREVRKSRRLPVLQRTPRGGPEEYACISPDRRGPFESRSTW